MAEACGDASEFPALGLGSAIALGLLRLRGLPSTVGAAEMSWPGLFDRTLRVGAAKFFSAGAVASAPATSGAEASGAAPAGADSSTGGAAGADTAGAEAAGAEAAVAEAAGAEAAIAEAAVAEAVGAGAAGADEAASMESNPFSCPLTSQFELWPLSYTRSPSRRTKN